MSSLRTLYARTVLFLIRPALELHRKRMESQRQDEFDTDLTNRFLSNKSSLSVMLRAYYGLKHPNHGMK